MRLLVSLSVALRIVLAASTFTLGFLLSISKDGSITLPKSACAAELPREASADVCETNSQIINGEYRVCVTCCNDAGACRSFCH